MPPGAPGTVAAFACLPLKYPSPPRSIEEPQHNLGEFRKRLRAKATLVVRGNVRLRP